MPTPVLATKLFAPPRRRQLVVRPRLLRRLDATLEAGQRLTVVSAPAGFGKTTLLSDWLDTRQTPAGVGWLSLDADDNNPERFLTHLVAAFHSAGLSVDSAALDFPYAAPGTVLTALVNQITRAAQRPPVRPWVLILDDYHAVDARAVHEAVTFLIDHLPQDVHLVLATRSDPPLPLAQLRGRGQLIEVRAADLRFALSEAQEFLTRVMDLDLTTAEMAALQDRTEGWIAGLQLAALSVRGIPERREVGAFIGAFTGSDRLVVDYLLDEVLARQPAGVRDFLLGTAVLDRLTGPLCDAVTGRADGVRMLADLERANLFVVPLDTHRSWYRYHHLFADVLRARLSAERPEQVPAIHRRASAWYASHDLVVDAVRHALAAADFHRAAYLMEEALPGLRRTRQDGVLLAWIRALPEPVVRRSPVLSTVAAWSLLMSGDVDSAGSRLDDAEAALAAGADDEELRNGWADTGDLRTAPATIAVYRAAVAQARGDVAATVRHARRALDLADPGDHFVRGAGAGYLGLAAWAAGDLRKALSTFGDAVRSLHAAGNLVDELDATVVLADMWVASGRPGRARRLLEQALRAATAGGEPYPRAVADLHVGLAELDHELDDLASAETHLQTAHVLGDEHGSITENRHRWFLAMAQVRAASGEFDAAIDLLDRAETLYRRGFYPEVRPIAATRARLHIASGDLTSADLWADEAGVTVDDGPDHLREYEQLTLVRLLLARHRAAGGRAAHPPPVAAVLDLLDRLHEAAVDAGRAGSLLEIRVLQALARHACGDVPGALAALSLAVTEAPEPDSYVRLYLDEGVPMLELLRDTTDPGDERFRIVLERLQGTETSVPPAQPLADPLSPRELEVLRLLDSDLTGPEIAGRLYVTVNTLRTHTKRIFTKLDVTTRAAAVRRAHEVGLI